MPNLKAVMVSYGDFHQMRKPRERAMKQGLRSFLGLPEGVRVYLDNAPDDYTKLVSPLPDDVQFLTKLASLAGDANAQQASAYLAAK